MPEPVLSISATPCKHFSTGFSAEWKTQLLAIKPYFSCPCNHKHSCTCVVCNIFALIKGWESPNNISLELQPETLFLSQLTFSYIPILQVTQDWFVRLLQGLLFLLAWIKNFCLQSYPYWYCLPVQVHQGWGVVNGNE